MMPAKVTWPDRLNYDELARLYAGDNLDPHAESTLSFQCPAARFPMSWQCQVGLSTMNRQATLIESICSSYNALKLNVKKRFSRAMPETLPIHRKWAAQKTKKLKPCQLIALTLI